MYEASYWRACYISIDSAAFIIGVTFLAWKDVESFLAKKSPLTGVSKAYVITGADFMQVAMAPPQGTSLYDVLAYATENYALADSGGFFAGAEQV